MVELVITQYITLKDYKKLISVDKFRKSMNENEFNTGDKVKCDIKMAKYLLGDNPLNKPVAKILEIIPDKKVAKKK